MYVYIAVLGPTCKDSVNDCSGVICKNGGTCIDGLNTYYCSCYPGFRGRHCGTKGDAELKGQKGDRGPAGMPGAKGEPGIWNSAPVVAVSRKTQTVNEGGSVSFQCSVSGNPKPVIVWSKTNKQSSRSVISEGKLLLKNVRGSDSGTYNCSAVNILGQAQALVQLIVNGKIVIK